jgi:hypothetical protein
MRLLSGHQWSEIGSSEHCILTLTHDFVILGNGNHLEATHTTSVTTFGLFNHYVTLFGEEAGLVDGSRCKTDEMK